YDFADTLDEEFFKENAILMSYVYVDKGEKVTIDKVRRKNHLGFGVLMMYISIEDSIKPSSNDDMDVYTCIAVIDKNETIGYDWTNCDFEIK
ncbi:MAG: hypothetical protein IKK94_02970, partial [Clostridia bacterium]|nr:hypothetical protein [Clostridia bacterium]